MILKNLNLIVAVNDKYVIGDKGEIPWYIPAELNHFKEMTMPGILIAGYKTYKSIEDKLPFRRRHVVVMSRNKSDTDAPKALHVYNLDGIIKVISTHKPTTFWVIGGAEIYRELEPYCRRVILSHVDDASDGDTKVEDIFKKYEDREPVKTTVYEGFIVKEYINNL